MYGILKVLTTWKKIPDFSFKIIFTKILSLFEYDLIIG